MGREACLSSLFGIAFDAQCFTDLLLVSYVFSVTSRKPERSPGCEGLLTGLLRVSWFLVLTFRLSILS